ncbi:MAG: alcohol dehydrogenase family protein [Pseudomonadota bacterium]
MKAVQLVGHGGLDQLVYREDVPVPVPGARDVLIRVAAAGVNNTDLNTRLGWYSKGGDCADDASWSGDSIAFPRIQGADVCGEIVAIGSDVDPSLLRRRVLVEPCLREAHGEELLRPWYCGSECDGGFAQYTTVAARHAYPIDSALSSVELASFPCSYSTALNMLHRTAVGEDDAVLITGASGGVGSAAVQIAKARGARVMAVAAPDKSQGLTRLGADRVIPRDANLTEVLAKDSADVIIDLVGGPRWPALLDVLRPFGRYAVAGAIAGPHVELDLRTVYLKDLQLFGCTVLSEGVFASLVAQIEAGRIAPLVAEVFPLEEIAAAQTAFAAKRHVGKLVIDVGACA